MDFSQIKMRRSSVKCFPNDGPNDVKDQCCANKDLEHPTKSYYCTIIFSQSGETSDYKIHFMCVSQMYMYISLSSLY